jgi:hypothetical protein
MNESLSLDARAPRRRLSLFRTTDRPDTPTLDLAGRPSESTLSRDELRRIVAEMVG